MAEVESFPLAGSDADLPLAAAEEVICLFAFIECADSLEPPDEPPERRLMLHRVGARGLDWRRADGGLLRR